MCANPPLLLVSSGPYLSFAFFFFPQGRENWSLSLKARSGRSFLLSPFLPSRQKASPPFCDGLRTRDWSTQSYEASFPSFSLFHRQRPLLFPLFFLPWGHQNDVFPRERGRHSREGHFSRLIGSPPSPRTVDPPSFFGSTTSPVVKAATRWAPCARSSPQLESPLSPLRLSRQSASPPPSTSSVSKRRRFLRGDFPFLRSFSRNNRYPPFSPPGSTRLSF